MLLPNTSIFHAEGLQIIGIGKLTTLSSTSSNLKDLTLETIICNKEASFRVSSMWQIIPMNVERQLEVIVFDCSCQ